MTQAQMFKLRINGQLMFGMARALRGATSAAELIAEDRDKLKTQYHFGDDSILEFDQQTLTARVVETEEEINDD